LIFFFRRRRRRNEENEEGKKKKQITAKPNPIPIAKAQQAVAL
jgi:hypothetical protein